MAKIGNPYNNFQVPNHKTQARNRLRKTKDDTQTQLALAELASIQTWAEFVRICKTQEHKRDGTMTWPEFKAMCEAQRVRRQGIYGASSEDALDTY